MKEAVVELSTRRFVREAFDRVRNARDGEINQDIAGKVSRITKDSLLASKSAQLAFIAV